MALWRNQILPRLIDLALGTDEVAVWRKKCLQGISGVVVEPGFGSGLNIAHMPSDVTKVYAVDPAIVGQKLAADRVAASPIDVEYVGLDGQRLPLDDASCDAGLLTFTLCTIPDAPTALAELRRVIRPGGTLHFVEHGAAPDHGVKKWQDRVTPLQKRIADGCHLNRPMVDLITDAGFVVEWSDASYVGRPKAVSYFICGVAHNPASDG
jgi:ubiquinone/menaquinone biosynthesis C-methylase UbiE